MIGDYEPLIAALKPGEFLCGGCKTVCTDPERCSGCGLATTYRVQREFAQGEIAEVGFNAVTYAAGHLARLLERPRPWSLTWWRRRRRTLAMWNEYDKVFGKAVPTPSPDGHGEFTLSFDRGQFIHSQLMKGAR